jgi:aspartate aminotransferase
LNLAERVFQLPFSLTAAVDSKVKAMQRAGVDVISFGAGETDFDTPDHVKEAAIQAIRGGATRYTPVGGSDELKEAVRNRLREDLGLAYQQDEVVVSCGGKHALYNIAQTLWGPGDEVIVPAPYWVSYPPMILLAGATPVILPTREENGFKVTPEELASAVTPRTRAVIINSPANPTGSVYRREELAALGPIILKKDLLVVSDDIYDKIIFDGRSFVNPAMLGKEYQARTLVVNGVSKSYAMTGWRIGYSAGPREIIGAIHRIQSHSTSNPNSIAQKAALAALQGPQEIIRQMNTALDTRRKYMSERLRALPDVPFALPEGAFYIFPNFSAYYRKKINGKTVKDSLELADYLLERARIAVVPGVAFGEDRCLRFSYATSPTLIEKGLDRLEKALKG